MGRRSNEFHAFDSLMGKLLVVPKSTIHERHAATKRRPRSTLASAAPSRKSRRLPATRDEA